LEGTYILDYREGEVHSIWGLCGNVTFKNAKAICFSTWAGRVTYFDRVQKIL
jgi:hypothetical protein